ncbi:MAG: hypothetical protein ACI9SG_000484 [Maribacter sp.]
MIVFSILSFGSCTEDTKEQDDCSTLYFAGQTLRIKFMSSEGEDLITNETYSLETIKDLNAETQVNDFGNVTDTSRITIAISGVTGTIAYHVILNDSETDTLVLNFKKIVQKGNAVAPHIF